MYVIYNHSVLVPVGVIEITGSTPAFRIGIIQGMKPDMRVFVQLSDGQTTQVAEMDAITLSKSPPSIRLVWEWANVDGEDQPNTYCDVQLPDLQDAGNGLFALKNRVIRLPQGIELKP